MLRSTQIQVLKAPVLGMGILRTRETPYLASSELFNRAETQTLNLASVGRPFLRRVFSSPGFEDCVT